MKEFRPFFFIIGQSEALKANVQVQDLIQAGAMGLLEAVSAVRPVERVEVFSPTVDHVLRHAPCEVMVIAYPQGVLEEDAETGRAEVEDVPVGVLGDQRSHHGDKRRLRFLAAESALAKHESCGDRPIVTQFVRLHRVVSVLFDERGDAGDHVPVAHEALEVDFSGELQRGMVVHGLAGAQQGGGNNDEALHFSIR